MRVAMIGILILMVATVAAAEEKLLQNETLVNGSGGAIQAGFIAGDIGSAVLTADAGDTPFQLKTVQILTAEPAGGIQFRDFIITVYNNGNVNPGAPIYTSPATTLASSTFTEIDLTAENIILTGTTFAVGASPVSGGSGQTPNLVTSIGGCSFGKNRIFDVNSSLWFDGCSLGISGQIAIRAVIITSGGSGNPPSVSVCSPDNGDPAGGDTISIFGTDFASGATVTFDGVAATSVTFQSANLLEVVTPAGAGGPADVEVCNPDLQCDTLVGGYTYNELACFEGSVTPVTDILTINGSSGGAGRTVVVAESGLILATLVKPPAGGNGKFVAHANFGLPTEGTETVLPAQIGTFCFPIILQQGGAPDAVWNNIGKENKVGASTYFDGSPQVDPERAPTTFLELFSGDATNLPMGTDVTFQAVIIDPDSPSPKSAACSNVMILSVQ